MDCKPPKAMVVHSLFHAEGMIDCPEIMCITALLFYLKSFALNRLCQAYQIISFDSYTTSTSQSGKIPPCFLSTSSMFLFVSIPEVFRGTETSSSPALVTAPRVKRLKRTVKCFVVAKYWKLERPSGTWSANLASYYFEYRILVSTCCSNLLPDSPVGICWNDSLQMSVRYLICGVHSHTSKLTKNVKNHAYQQNSRLVTFSLCLCPLRTYLFY